MSWVAYDQLSKCVPKAHGNLIAAVTAQAPHLLLPQETGVEGQRAVQVADAEQIPLTEDGGIEDFLKREVLPYVMGLIRQGFEKQMGNGEADA